MYYQHKNNQNIYELVRSNDDTVLLSHVDSKETKVVAKSTLKRYYTEIAYEEPTPVRPAKRQCPYYKQYKRNTQPLWNVEVDGSTLYISNNNGVRVIKCTLSKSKVCIKVEQIASRGKRYFSNVAKAKQHILYDQDINTTKYIGDKFDKWVKQQTL